MSPKWSYPYLRVTTRCTNPASLAFICPDLLGRADGPMPPVRRGDVPRLRRGHEPPRRAPVVQRLRDAPAVRHDRRGDRPQRRIEDGVALRRPLREMPTHPGVVLRTTDIGRAPSARPMRLAVLADVHANLPALAAVLRDVDSLSPAGLWVAGDLVGYNPWPNEVLQILRDRHAKAIRGNHDRGVLGDDPVRSNKLAGALAPPRSVDPALRAPSGPLRHRRGRDRDPADRPPDGTRGPPVRGRVTSADFRSIPLRRSGRLGPAPCSPSSSARAGRHGPLPRRRVSMLDAARDDRKLALSEVQGPSRSSIRSRPFSTRNSSSSRSWWCQTNSPFTFTSFT